MNRMSELKRCPFCGGEARMHKTAFLKYEVEVVCKNCGARTLTHSSASFSDANMNAIKAWNTRKPMDRTVEQIKSLRGYEIYKNTFDLIIGIVKEEGLK